MANLCDWKRSELKLIKGMEKRNYQAGAVSKGFWFNEFRKYNHLLKEGYDEKTIKGLQKNENILLASSPAYGRQKLNEVARRTRALPQAVSQLFFSLNVSDQKIINLLGIMMTDRLFFDYLYESYRENIILGRKNFDDSGLRIFFKNKSDQSEKVAGFTDQTKKRLASSYKSYLKEANLIIEEGGLLVYNKVLLDLDLENRMKDPGLYPYLKALRGGD